MNLEEPSRVLLLGSLAFMAPPGSRLDAAVHKDQQRSFLVRLSENLRLRGMGL